MLMSKNMIDSVLPTNLKQLINDGNTESLDTVISNLKINLNQFQDEVKKVAQVNFKPLKPVVEDAENLKDQINSLHSQISSLRTNLQENEKSLKNVSEIDEYKKLIDRIEMINRIISIIEVLQQYDGALEDFTMSIGNKDYTKCYDKFGDLSKMTNCKNLTSKNSKSKSNKEAIESNQNILKEIVAFKLLNEEFTMQKERLWYELNLEWDKLLQVQMTTADKSGSITIQSNVSQDFLSQLTKFSVYKNNQFVFESKIKLFSGKFLQFCEENIISSSLYNINIIENDEEGIKTLQLVNDQTEELATESLLELKLNQIEMILKFLNKNLFGLNVYTNETDNQPLMAIFANVILKDFVKLIYEKLIISIIPLENFDFKLESEICQRVDQFESSLKAIKFLGKKQTLTSVFDSFKSNVEELYVRKKCKFIMEKSRELMKQKEALFKLELLDERSLKAFDSELPEDSSYIIKTLEKLEQETGFSNKKCDLNEYNLLRMHKCSISSIAKKTIDIVYSTFNEALCLTETAQDIKNISLLCLVARNLFDLYANVIPIVHRDCLRDLPLLSAIVYNDFMFMAFNCLTITSQYKNMLLSLKSTKKTKLNGAELNEIVENFSCLDLIPKFYEIAANILNGQIENQQEMMMQFLTEDCNGIADISEGTNFDEFKRALQKCIFQLNKLASLWLDVLPEQIYDRVFGQFFNFICTYLIKSCLRLEDISSDDASYLHAAFSLLRQCVFEIFSKSQKKFENDSNEDATIDATIENKIADFNATKYIKLWQKFKYLLKVLTANLQEIVDLWSESKGPLALYFDSEEIRHLIRALFMITDKRSAALAKIK